MKIRNSFLIRFLGFLATCLIRLWVRTIHLKIVNCDANTHPGDFRHKRFLYSFWHESILAMPHFHTRIHILISHHTDGEFITKVAQCLGARVVRGSTSRGGTEALLKLLKISQSSHLLVTPDGPRGPRRRVHIGLLFLAAQTGLPIVPCGVGYKKFWRARSWDRFVLPAPFTSGVFLFGPAIHVPKKINRRTLESYRVLVEQRMQELTETAELWAAGERMPKSEEQRLSA